MVAPLDADCPPADDVAPVADLVAAGAFTRLLDDLTEAARRPCRDHERTLTDDGDP
ncbi:MAG TPA: hypothetical protein VNT55_09015 [Baekduia sp.]|nr:hypothetical protein [Baekduia sp.]